jgi:hypothetical protein
MNIVCCRHFVGLHSVKSYIYEICVFFEALSAYIMSGSWINYHSCHSHPTTLCAVVTDIRRVNYTVQARVVMA